MLSKWLWVPNQTHQSSTFKHCATPSMDAPHSTASCSQLQVLQKKRCMCRGRGEFTSQIMALTPTADQLKRWRMRSDYNHSANVKLKCYEGMLRAMKSILLYLDLIDEKRSRMTQSSCFWMQAEKWLPKVRLKSNWTKCGLALFKVLVLKYTSFWIWKKR